MPNFFSLGNNDNNTGHYGFVQQNIIPAAINDALMDSGDILNKMGTSIPTPYARLYLFDSAFAQINAYNNNQNLQGIAHEGVLDNQNKIVPTAYHHLVSECLDMLEFIFKYGGQKKFDVIEWDVQAECQILNQQGTGDQKELSAALLDAYQNTHLNAFSKIYIFTWEVSQGNNIIIGGTSPITLVYTSPNLRRLLKANNLQKEFKGDAGNVLFDSEVCTPLHKRSQGFREFVHTYWLTDLAKEKIKETEFFTYIKESKAGYDKKLNINIANPVLQGVNALNSSAGTITTAGVYLYCSINEFQVNDCDYVIVPNQPESMWNTEIVNGETRRVNAPLVLNTNGLDNKRYAPRPWNKSTDKIPPFTGKPLTERELPGTAFTYPYLSVDDFLEEKIIVVSYKIRKNCFYTGSATDVKHLLPLKKEFFKFFKPTDIPNLVKMSVNKDTEVVTVELNIPVSGGTTISLKKVYEEDDQLLFDDGTKEIDLAIFPSYRIPLDPNGKDNNVYNVMFGSLRVDAQTKFYKVENLSKTAEQRHLSTVIEKVRVDGGNNDITTRHINIPSSFDFMEIIMNGISGLVVPKFKEVIQKTRNFTFCVDFGTTNTHVSYVSKPNGDATPVTVNQIQTFEIEEDDMQVMLLNDASSFGQFLKYKTYLLREFVPLLINSNADFHYPMRTASWETNLNVPNLKTFENMSIGFNYDRELSLTETMPGCYRTNIKWARQDTLASSRMQSYFMQLLWMMKSKSILNGGGEDFEVVVTYPQSMSAIEKGTIKKAWEQAKNTTKSHVTLKFELEGITPYYSFLGALMRNASQPYMNVDIGGGTTDILHIVPSPGKQPKSFTLSAIFAANDIWGDGCNDICDPKQNGFIKYYLQSDEFNLLDDTKKSELNSVVQNAVSSADIMSYLFSHDADNNSPTQVSQAITRSTDMMKVVITHFSGIMYYLAMVLDTCDLEIPANITFTGMGSKYIKLIANDEDSIGNFVSKIFAYYGKLSDNKKLKVANVKIMFAENPKIVTAQGGLILNSRKIDILPEQILCHGYEGEEYGDTVRYKDVFDYKECTINSYNRFADMFKEGNISNIISSLGHDIPSQFADELKQYASDSIDLMISQYCDPNMQDKSVGDPMFFWTMKNSLYILGIDCANQAIENSKKS